MHTYVKIAAYIRVNSSRLINTMQRGMEKMWYREY